jgi:hypothetical protein
MNRLTVGSEKAYLAAHFSGAHGVEMGGQDLPWTIFLSLRPPPGSGHGSPRLTESRRVASTSKESALRPWLTRVLLATRL